MQRKYKIGMNQSRNGVETEVDHFKTVFSLIFHKIHKQQFGYTGDMNVHNEKTTTLYIGAVISLICPCHYERNHLVGISLIWHNVTISEI